MSSPSKDYAKPDQYAWKDEAGQGIFASLFRATPGVVSYELARSRTPARIAMFVLMAGIPTALLIAVANLTPARFRTDQQTNLAFCVLLYALVPQVMTMLGMLVLASPIVHTELEGQTWIYSLIRYRGRRSLLLGKYIVAVLWTWITISLLCVLSSLAYGALFILIGVVFQKRVMVISFVYALLAEGLLAWIPAVVNQFTIAYRLRSILFRWLDLSVEKFFRSDGMVSNGMVAEDPTGLVQIGWVLAITALLLALALWLVERLQYSFQSEL